MENFKAPTDPNNPIVYLDIQIGEEKGKYFNLMQIELF